MESRITGLIGYPVSHSLSPVIHAYWAKQYAIESNYKLFTTAPARLRQTMFHMRKKNVAGVNITVPHKQVVSEYLDDIDDTARRIGAVNTVINKKGKFIGSNTDSYGFISNLQQSIKGDLKDALSKVILLGAGGATRAAIVGLMDEGAKDITLVNRTEETARVMASHFGIKHARWEGRETLLSDASLLVNTTSLGMVGKPSLELDISHLTPVAIVHDIVYAPLVTPLLKQARLQGNPTVDGLGMLLYQAQLAFEYWHGIKPEVNQALRDHVLAHQKVEEVEVSPTPDSESAA